MSIGVVALSALPRLIVLACIACVCHGLGGCRSAANQFERRAQAAGLERIEVPGTRFTHFVYRSRTSRIANHPTDTLLVYLDGDGTPGTGHGAEPSIDPTPRNPLALSLMMQSTRPAIYLTRPCYNDLHNQPGCDNTLWTAARYSSDVVTSMATALTRYAHDQGDPALIIVGYSGGGTLAMLMAQLTPQLKGIVTVAANLDTQAWTAVHNYLPLEGSLNPADLDDLPLPIIHLVGEQDTNVPPSILTDYFNHHPRAQVWRYASFDHRCCWVVEWPTLLEQALRYMDAAKTKL